MASEALTAAVVGAGKMGCDISALLAAHGWKVHAQEPDAGMRASLPGRFARSIAPLRAPKRAARRFRIHERLDSMPWGQIALVIEAVPEQLPLKQQLFREIEALAPRDTILTTNTSSLRRAEVMRKVKHKDRAATVPWP